MLNFTIHKLGDTALFRCTGRFVAGETEALTEALQEAIRRHWRARIVVLDLAEITGVDAAGVGALISVRECALRSGIAFKLMNLRPRVEEVLELTNVRNAFEVCCVADMFELLCRAIRQTQPARSLPAEIPTPLAPYIQTPA